MKTYKSVLLVIDLVNDFTQPEGKCYYETTGRMMPTVINFINECRKRGVLIIYVQQVSSVNRPLNKELTSRQKLNCVEGSGGELLDSRLPVDESVDYILKKSRADAFYRTELEGLLTAVKAENVMVCGTKTNCCVRATATGAAMRDYKTFMISDCVSSNTDEISQIHLADMNKYFAKSITSTEVLQRLDQGEL